MNLIEKATISTKEKTAQNIYSKRTKKRGVISQNSESDPFPSDMANENMADISAIIMVKGVIKSGNVPLNGDLLLLNAATVDADLNSGADLSITSADNITSISLANWREAAVYKVKITRAIETQGPKAVNPQFIYASKQSGDNITATIGVDWEDKADTLEFNFIPYLTDLKNIRSACKAYTPKSVPAAFTMNNPMNYGVTVEVVSKADIMAFYQSID